MNETAERIDKKCEPLFKDYMNRNQINDEHENQIIYHYTNFEGLKGILSTRRFWFTDFRHLNDPSELTHSLNLIEGFIKERRNGNDEKEKLEFFLTRLRYAVEQYIVGTVSFCNSECRDYLPAWRCYSSNGAGFTLGIKAKAIEQLQHNEEKEGYMLWPFIHYKIAYEQNAIEEYKEYINNLLNIFLEEINGKTKPHNETRTIATTIASYIFPLLPHCKHTAYKEENEYRFVLFEKNPTYKKGREINSNPSEDKCGYFLRSNRKENNPFPNPITTIISKQFDKENIAEIGIGPACNKGQARYEIKKILRKNEFSNEEIEKINIYDSTIPYCG